MKSGQEKFIENYREYRACLKDQPVLENLNEELHEGKVEYKRLLIGLSQDKLDHKTS